MARFRPADERALAEVVVAAVAREETLELVAGGSKRGLGRPAPAPHLLDLSAFSGIRAYEPAERRFTAGAATPLGEIEAALAARGQCLAFEPPDWRALLGAGAARPTLGGVIACNLSGPRRVRAGAARDHFVGFRAVSGRAETFTAGGAAAKNVAGHDLCKLVAGSYGTLCALTEVTVTVWPSAAAEASLLLSGLDDAAAQRAMAAALDGSQEVSGAAHLPAGESGRGRPLTLLRLEGPAPSLAARAAALRGALASFGVAETAEGEDSARLWRAVRDLAPFAGCGGRAVWRLSLPAAAGPAVAAAAGAMGAAHFFDWGGLLLWLALPEAGDGGAAAIRAALARSGGHATLIRASDGLRAAVPVFQPQSPGLAALGARVKSAFDPKRIFNRGRMYADL